jgi:hypothetical protein
MNRLTIGCRNEQNGPMFLQRWVSFEWAGWEHTLTPILPWFEHRIPGAKDELKDRQKSAERTAANMWPR